MYIKIVIKKISINDIVPHATLHYLEITTVFMQCKLAK